MKFLVGPQYSVGIVHLMEITLLAIVSTLISAAATDAGSLLGQEVIPLLYALNGPCLLAVFLAAALK